MMLCRCDMCEAVADIAPQESPYRQPPNKPKGWAVVHIAREHSIEAPAPAGQRMTFLSPAMGQVEARLESTDAPKPEPITVPVQTELQLCAKCTERLLNHPALLKRLAADDTRTEALALRGGLG